MGCFSWGRLRWRRKTKKNSNDSKLLSSNLSINEIATIVKEYSEINKKIEEQNTSILNYLFGNYSFVVF